MIIHLPRLSEAPVMILTLALNRKEARKKMYMPSAKKTLSIC